MRADGSGADGGPGSGVGTRSAHSLAWFLCPRDHELLMKQFKRLGIGWGPMSFGCTGCRRIRFLARGIVVHDALLLRWSVPSAPRVARADRRDRALWRHAYPANSEHPVYLWSDTRWRARGQFIAISHSAMLWTCPISSATASNRALHEGTTRTRLRTTAVHDHPPVLGPIDEGVPRCWAWLPACAKYLLQMCQCRWITPTADCGVMCPSRVS